MVGKVEKLEGIPKEKRQSVDETLAEMRDGIVTGTSTVNPNDVYAAAAAIKRGTRKKVDDDYDKQVQENSRKFLTGELE